MAINNENTRVAWADVLRAFAIYCLILAHLGSMSAYISFFCFGFVVQLFFFVSGLFAAKYESLTIKQLLIRLLNRLLIPYIALCIINMTYYALAEGTDVGAMALQAALGIRNKLFAPALWFLPCLIVMTLLYYLLCKAVHNKNIVLVICLAVSLAFRLLKEQSEWFWSIDSAMLYIFYYALGDRLMLFLSGFTLKGKTTRFKAVIAALGAFSAAVSVFAYLVYMPTQDKPINLTLSDTQMRLFVFFTAIVIILLLTGVSMLLQKSRVLQTIGKLTLLTANLESVASWLFFQICWLLGISWIVREDWQTLIYGAVLLLFTTYAVALPLRKLLPFVFARHEKP